MSPDIVEFDISYGEVNYLMRYIGSGTHAFVPDGVNIIKCGAFYYRYNLEHVTMADSVEVVCDEAFSYCERLQCITFGKGVRKVYCGAISRCENLHTILVEPGNPCYYSTGDCLIETATKTVVLRCPKATIPSDSSVEGIGEKLFWGYRHSREIAIPDNVKTIGKQAFQYSNANVLFGKGIEHIGEEAFSHCSCMDQPFLHKGLKTIGKKAFYRCEDLRAVTFPDTLTEMGESAFCACYRIQKIFYTGNIPILDAFELTDKLALWVFANPSFFHPDDIRYCFEEVMTDLWYYAKSHTPFDSFLIQNLSCQELRVIEDHGLITKENGELFLELLRLSRNVEGTNEMVRYLSENHILGDWEDRFRLDLDD